MIRSNVGNMVTNAMQTLAITGTTAVRVLGRADKTLNNKAGTNQQNANKPSLTEEQQRDYDQMQVDKKLEKIERHKQKTDDAFRRLSGEEQVAYREAQADKMRKFAGVGDDESVDDLMAETENAKSIVDSVVPADTSEQAGELNQSINANISYSIQRTYRDKKTGRFIKKPEEVNKDANV